MVVIIETIYKIRRRSDGMFSMGGLWPRFSRFGKIWKSQGLSSHFTNVAKRATSIAQYRDCEVVTYEIHETACEPTSNHFAAERGRRDAFNARMARLRGETDEL